MRSKFVTGEQAEPTFIEAARRAQLIRCAIDVIAESGYAHASLAQIAARAGVSKSVISYHFAGKDDLINRVIDEVYQDCWAFMEPRIAAEPTAWGQLRAFIESELAYMAGHRTELRAIAVIFMHTLAGEANRHQADAEQAFAAVEAILERGQRAGEFRAFSPRVMAVTVNQALDGALSRAVLEPDVDLVAYAAELVALFDLGLRLPPQSAHPIENKEDS